MLQIQQVIFFFFLRFFNLSSKILKFLTFFNFFLKFLKFIFCLVEVRKKIVELGGLEAILSFKDSKSDEELSMVCVGLSNLSELEECKLTIGKFLVYVTEIVKGPIFNKFFFSQCLKIVENCSTLGKIFIFYFHFFHFFYFFYFFYFFFKNKIK
jgi:hypothetical protein